ncbi:Hypothetical predicted protein [Mytilus galloprovincialis]|uniref:Uncharacterized protein n=1 Tax=Mytilus galloprovincialis TaxID=29158 RepID=A0A8B6BW96_MYTGA|nr:Hypothetical predicted protein [Mytilus galloprovincialis]
MKTVCTKAQADFAALTSFRFCLYCEVCWVWLILTLVDCWNGLITRLSAWVSLDFFAWEKVLSVSALECGRASPYFAECNTGVWLVERTAKEICFTMANSINVILTGKRVKPDVLTNDPSDKMELHKEKVKKFRKKSK